MSREMLSTDLRLSIAQKCVCQAGRNRWGAIGSHRPLAVIRGREEGKEKVGNGNGEGRAGKHVKG